VEDGLYCEMSRFFSDRSPFKPFLPDAPVGYHKPERGNLDTLTNDYVNFLQGSALVSSIEYLLQHFGKDFSPAALDLACYKGPEAQLHEFSPARTEARKNRQKPYHAAMAALEYPELSEAYVKFSDVSIRDASPPDLVQQVERFFHVQAQWKRFLTLRAEASDFV
ncbi:MAG TPA: hypothetical protein VI874_04795, partial [Candidatus Norongarragalinales archaeon]|nr:hypothetical protein [Candidatus Norongarragalinales archaeon]